MSKRGRGKLIAVAFVWLVILGAAAATYRYVFAPKREQSLIERTGSAPARSGLESIALALDSFSGYAILRSDAMAEELEAEGFVLEFVDDGADYARRLETVASGKTPLAVFTVDALIKTSAQAGGLPGTIVMALDETRGADAMVAYKDSVPNIDALNNPAARVVLAGDSPSETLARVVTSNFQLPELSPDWMIKTGGAEEAYQQLKSQRGAAPRAYVLWEPYVSKALENKDVHVLVDSSRFKGYIADVLVARREFLIDNEDKVAAVIRAYLRAQFAHLNQPKGMEKLVAADSAAAGEPLTAEQAERLVQGVWWKNTQENYAHMGILTGAEAHGLQTLDAIIRNITRVLTKTGAIAADPTGGEPAKLYFDRIFRRLHDEKFYPGIVGAAGEETIRAEAPLKPLRDDQWDALSPVGTLEVERIVFSRGAARLTSQSKLVLEGLAETLELWPHYYLVIRGHARAAGDAEANRRLAAQRAEATREFLESAKAPAIRMRAVTEYGAERGGRAQSVSFVLGQLPY